MIVTRPRAQAEPLLSALRAEGFEAVLCPLLEIEAIDDGPIDLDGYDWVIVTSANGAVELARRRVGKLPRIAAIGEATAEALADHGLAADFVPSSASQESLVAELPRPVGRALFVGAAGARTLLADELPADFRAAYRTLELTPTPPAGDLVLLASASAARAWAKLGGSGPVVTIGEFGAGAEPTVSIEGVTITGGITRSSPESTPFTGQEGVFAAGGGVEIPPNADFSGGATVTIASSVITGNRVAPSDTAPFGPPCPSGPCPFAFAGGGGIDSWGMLTLANTTISNNRVGSASGLSTLASDAVGGAITNRLGPLTIIGSVIHGNRASATGQNGRFAEGGAIMAFGGTLKVSNSSVTENSAALAASLPNSVELLAEQGADVIALDRAAYPLDVSRRAVRLLVDDRKSDLLASHTAQIRRHGNARSRAKRIAIAQVEERPSAVQRRGFEQDLVIRCCQRTVARGE